MYTIISLCSMGSKSVKECRSSRADVGTVSGEIIVHEIRASDRGV